MSTYKIHRKADGSVGGFGPNVNEYQPYLEDGDTLEYSDTMPDMQNSVDAPPVTISSDTITIPDAELLVAAATAGDKTAEWLIAKLEL